MVPILYISTPNKVRWTYKCGWEHLHYIWIFPMLYKDTKTDGKTNFFRPSFSPPVGVHCVDCQRSPAEEVRVHPMTCPCFQTSHIPISASLTRYIKRQKLRISEVAVYLLLQRYSLRSRFGKKKGFQAKHGWTFGSRNGKLEERTLPGMELEWIFFHQPPHTICWGNLRCLFFTLVIGQVFLRAWKDPMEAHGRQTNGHGDQSYPPPRGYTGFGWT